MEMTDKIKCAVCSEEEVHCEQQPDKVINAVLNGFDVVFCICEEHAKGLDEGKTYIVRDMQSNNYFMLQMNLPSNNSDQPDTIEESQFEPPLGQESTVI